MIKIDGKSLTKILNSHMDLIDMQSKINSYEKDSVEELDLMFEAEEFQEALEIALKRNKKFISKQKKILKSYGMTYDSGIVTFASSKVEDTDFNAEEFSYLIGKELDKMALNKKQK